MKTEFANMIEEFIKNNPHHGYRSISQFMEDAARQRLEGLKAKEVKLSRFEQVNHGLDGVKILDRQIHHVADIYFKPEGIWCDLCKADSCIHIDFALAQKDIQSVIKKRRKEGWKLPEV